MAGTGRTGSGPVCCGLIPHLELARRPELYGGPVVVGAYDGPVVAASEEAAAYGVRPGIPLRQAQQRCPQAAVYPPDSEQAQRLRQLIASALYDLAAGGAARPWGRARLAAGLDSALLHLGPPPAGTARGGPGGAALHRAGPLRGPRPRARAARRRGEESSREAVHRSRHRAARVARPPSPLERARAVRAGLGLAQGMEPASADRRAASGAA